MSFEQYSTGSQSFYLKFSLLLYIDVYYVFQICICEVVYIFLIQLGVNEP